MTVKLTLEVTELIDNYSFIQQKLIVIQYRQYSSWVQRNGKITQLGWFDIDSCSAYSIKNVQERTCMYHLLKRKHDISTRSSVTVCLW